MKLIITARQRSCQEVILSVMCVCQSAFPWGIPMCPLPIMYLDLTTQESPWPWPGPPLQICSKWFIVKHVRSASAVRILLECLLVKRIIHWTTPSPDILPKTPIVDMKIIPASSNPSLCWQIISHVIYYVFLSLSERLLVRVTRYLGFVIWSCNLIRQVVRMCCPNTRGLGL